MNDKNQNIDRLVQGIKSISTNRCSLSNDDIKILEEVINLLDELKQEDSELKQIQLFVKAIGILGRFFSGDNFLDGLM